MTIPFKNPIKVGDVADLLGCTGIFVFSVAAYRESGGPLFPVAAGIVSAALMLNVYRLILTGLNLHLEQEREEERAQRKALESRRRGEGR